MSTEPIPSYRDMYWFLLRLWLSHERPNVDKRLPGSSLAAWHAAVRQMHEVWLGHKNHSRLDVVTTTHYCMMVVTRAVYDELKHLPLSKHLRELEMPAWVAEMDDWG